MNVTKEVMIWNYIKPTGIYVVIDTTLKNINYL